MMVLSPSGEPYLLEVTPALALAYLVPGWTLLHTDDDGVEAQ